jgi:hypothetical protein
MLGLSIVSQHFMESESSIPNSQELSACSYPEPDQSSLHHPNPLLQDPSWYYPPTNVLVFLVASFPSGFPTNNLYVFLFFPHLCYVTRPSHPRLDYSNYTWRRVQITKLLVTIKNLKKLNSMVWVRERTVPTERPSLVGEVIANFYG